MEKQVFRFLISGLISSVFVFALSGCYGGEGVLRRSPIWVFYDEVNASLSRGDTRQKVRSILGDPLVDARGYRIEAYRKAGRDIDYTWALIPIYIPHPGDKAELIVLVVYDEDDVVMEIATSVGSATRLMTVAAGGFRFTTSPSDTQTLLGPSISWKDLAEIKAVDGKCALVLVNGMCAMRQVSLDDREIVDLSLTDAVCRGCFNGTFIRKNISSGKHHLSDRQKHDEFESEFECESGENVYAELEATLIRDWWHGSRLEGAISINKSPYKNLIDMDTLYPILWHRGVWYGPLDTPSTSTQ